MPRSTREMSSLVPFIFNNTKLFTVLIDGKPWTRAKELRDVLEYSKNTKAAFVIKEHCSIENIKHKHELEGVLKPLKWPKNSQPYEYYINEEGLLELVLKSQQPRAIDFAITLGIDLCKHKCLRKEQETVYYIMKAFSGEKMKRQLQVGTYRVDLYFPDHKLAIECDEHGHKDRDIQNEVTRQKYIENELECKFIRYNPDADDFDILNVINDIFREIKEHCLSIS